MARDGDLFHPHAVRQVGDLARGDAGGGRGSAERREGLGRRGLLQHFDVAEQQVGGDLAVLGSQRLELVEPRRVERDGRDGAHAEQVEQVLRGGPHRGQRERQRHDGQGEGRHQRGLQATRGGFVVCVLALARAASWRSRGAARGAAGAGSGRPSRFSFLEAGAQGQHRAVQDGADVGLTQVHLPGDLAVGEFAAVLEGDDLALAFGQCSQQSG